MFFQFQQDRWLMWGTLELGAESQRRHAFRRSHLPPIIQFIPYTVGLFEDCMHPLNPAIQQISRACTDHCKQNMEWTTSWIALSLSNQKHNHHAEFYWWELIDVPIYWTSVWLNCLERVFSEQLVCKVNYLIPFQDTIALPCSVKFVNKCVYRWPESGNRVGYNKAGVFVMLCEAVVEARFYIFLPMLFDFTFFETSPGWQLFYDFFNHQFIHDIHRRMLSNWFMTQTTGFAGVSSVPVLSLSNLWESFGHRLMLDDGGRVSHINVDDRKFISIATHTGFNNLGDFESDKVKIGVSRSLLACASHWVDQGIGSLFYDVSISDIEQIRLLFDMSTGLSCFLFHVGC